MAFQFFPDLVAPYDLFDRDCEIACELDRDNDERVADWRLVQDDKFFQPSAHECDVINGLIDELGLDAFGWRDEMASRRDAFGEAQAEMGVGL